MKYSEVGFRPLYHNLAIFPLCDVVRSVLKTVPGGKDADGILVWGYYDRDAGFSLEALAAAKREGDAWLFAKSNDDVRSFIRIEAVQDEEFFVRNEPDEKLMKRYASKLEVLSVFDVSDAIEKSRSFAFLDDSRDPVFIDDVLVYIEKKGLKPEGCWARIIDVTENKLWAKLLNEPDQDFGIHQGMDFTFFASQDEKTGKVTCHAHFSPMETIDPETLADGKKLKDAIHRFQENHDDTDALFWIFQILRDSDVWIPCNAVVSEEDQKTVEQMIEEAGDDLDSMVGKEFTARENIRLVPDILQKDGEYFFPVFSTEEDMGEYGEHFSKIQDHFLQAIDLAQDFHNDEGSLTGIVINAFTEPFVLPKDLFEAVQRLISRVEDTEE